MTTATNAAASRAMLAMIGFNTVFLVGNGVFMLIGPELLDVLSR